MTLGPKICDELGTFHGIKHHKIEWTWVNWQQKNYSRSDKEVSCYKSKNELVGCAPEAGPHFFTSLAAGLTN